MKIKFVKGRPGQRDAMVIRHGSHWVCGRYERYNYESNKSDKEIIVVKQKHTWFTVLILIHELAHYIARDVFKGKRTSKLNVWIDRNLIRLRDRR